ncbi:glycoside hydrolase superfamily [Mycena galopus ATCC 62051]|nr:glycoside hydrolase superfamily [Mycena galopus ATCC 62051]
MLSFLVLGTLVSPLGAVASQQLYLDGERLPDGFIYGCATSAYQVGLKNSSSFHLSSQRGRIHHQIEGAWNVDGKSPSIWDHFVHNKATNDITYGATGDVADNFYYSYPQDIPLFRKALGVGTYDFTIAWTRIMPAGRGPLNEKGLNFYQNVIRASNASGMSNICTLYHWDLPQSLQDQYGGWLSPKSWMISVHTRAQFSKRWATTVPIGWVTMNEPRTFCTEGFGSSPVSAPGVKGTYKDQYTCMHHALLAHAAAVDEYVKAATRGKSESSAADQAAAARAMDFEVGWDVAPLYTGDYPPSVVASGAPPMKFTAEEKELLKGSVDFIGLDFYTSQWVTVTQDCTPSSDSYPECTDTYQQDPRTGIDIGRPTASDWNFDAPLSTIYGGIKYLAEHYNATNILISETGMGV